MSLIESRAHRRRWVRIRLVPGVLLAALAVGVSAALAAASSHVVGIGLRGGPTPAVIAVNAHGTGVDAAAVGKARIATADWEATIEAR